MKASFDEFSRSQLTSSLASDANPESVTQSPQKDYQKLGCFEPLHEEDFPQMPESMLKSVVDLMSPQLQWLDECSEMMKDTSFDLFL